MPHELSPSAHVDTFTRDHLPPPEQWPELPVLLSELHYPEQLNCAVELLDRTAERFGPDRPCLLGENETWTYGEVVRASDKVAQLLAEDHGLVPGNRVLLRGPNSPATAVMWLATLKAGAVVVTTMPMLRAGELRTVGEMSQVHLALCDHRFLDDLAAAELPDLTILPYASGGPDDVLARAAAKPGDRPAVDTAADDIVMLAFTSGTTGRPKATMHMHRDVLAIADTFSRHVLRPVPEDVFTGTPPMAFTFGLGGILVFPLHAGAATLLLEKPTPQLLVDAVAKHGVTVLFTAPTAYRALLGLGTTVDLKGLRRAVSAGEALPASTWEAFHRRTGVKIIDGIGATEMLHIFISAADGDIRPGATGRPVPGFRARVIDADGTEVADGVVGRLAVQGPTGCRYLADERQLEYVQNGWNVTGDTYVRDADGYFWYQARSDDMIISAGYNIAGPEVESALLSHPDVAECGVVAASDPERGTIVRAYVVLVEGADGDPAKVRELQDHVKATIAPYKYPRSIRFTATLPRTATGKLQRFRLRQDAGGGADGSDALAQDG